MGEVVPARTSPTLLPPSPRTVCNYPVSKCPSASTVVTSTVRVKDEDNADELYSGIANGTVLTIELYTHRNHKLFISAFMLYSEEWGKYPYETVLCYRKFNSLFLCVKIKFDICVSI